MDPEVLRILKRVDRYLNALRALLIFNLLLTIAIIATALVGFFYVKSQVQSANDQLDSQVEEIKGKIPSTDSFNFR